MLHVLGVQGRATRKFRQLWCREGENQPGTLGSKSRSCVLSNLPHCVTASRMEPLYMSIFEFLRIKYSPFCAMSTASQREVHQQKTCAATGTIALAAFS